MIVIRSKHHIPSFSLFHHGQRKESVFRIGAGPPPFGRCGLDHLIGGHDLIADRSIDEGLDRVTRPETTRRDICFGGEECDWFRRCRRHIA